MKTSKGEKLSRASHIRGEVSQANRLFLACMHVCILHVPHAAVLEKRIEAHHSHQCYFTLYILAVPDIFSYVVSCLTALWAGHPFKDQGATKCSSLLFGKRGCTGEKNSLPSEPSF